MADSRLVAQALEFARPRAVIRDGGGRTRVGEHEVIVLDDSVLTRWETERRTLPLPPTRVEFYGARLEDLLRDMGTTVSPADRVLSMLSRAAGSKLPFPLRSFGRRVLEFPAFYTSLHPVAEACGTSRGALKARFRRRAIATPSTYLRWFRALAVADVLADRDVTVAAAARRCGYTSDGNLCRALASVAGMTPTEVRTVTGWNRLLITFAWTHLTPDAVEGWAALEDLFRRRIA